MSRRRTVIRRSVLALAALLVLALVGGTVAVTAIVRRPFPQAGGELVLPGLEAEARVLRDELGVPQIYATTPEDLFRAQGYVNAQDRFFEMDYRRHVTAGRLAELVGDNPTAIEADRVVRTFGWRRVAEQEWDLLEPETRSYLQAYADGVNAYLEDRSTTQLAMEYTVLGVQVDVEAPEPWDPIDSVAWLKAMAWDLRGNY
ncbi:MAG: penicillin acylase family protein, partial [Cellulomonadaceae bacterium]